MSQFIVQVYIQLIKEGRRTIESVPEQIRAEVAAALEAEAKQE